MERKIVIITGPTCSGKTKIGISCALKFNSEVISADSRQIYKYLDIGTAKPTLNELNSVKHHFVDLLSPDEDFNVSKYEDEAIKIMTELAKQEKIPVVVGGSGLYIKAIIDGIFNSVDSSEEFREELKFKREKFGNQFLYDELEKVDPESAAKMLPQNWKRVMRALEVLHLTGEPIWKFQQSYKRESSFHFFQFGLEWDRKVLYKNIELRVDQMIENGLVSEVTEILSKGYSPTLNSLNTVGYKEIISYLNNEISLDRAIELIKRNTRRFAKRQLTWFRKDERIKWFKINSETDLNFIDEKILKELSNL